MNTVALERLMGYISTVHAKHADGCKSSCGHRVVGYHHSDLEESYWYAIFGGYCLGSLPRRVYIKAKNATELECKVKSVIDKACLENTDPKSRPAKYPELSDNYEEGWIAND